jgi:hypothetical protein
MKFPSQFLGGSLVSLAIGMSIGASLVEGKEKVNYAQFGGVRALIAVAGVMMERTGSAKSHPATPNRQDVDGAQTEPR